jgi:hypothetical protein
VLLALATIVINLLILIVTLLSRASDDAVLLTDINQRFSSSKEADILLEVNIFIQLLAV